jgi:hypothetical protein
MIGGLTVSLVLVLLGPDVLGKDDAIFPLAILRSCRCPPASCSPGWGP